MPYIVMSLTYAEDFTPCHSAPQNARRFIHHHFHLRVKVLIVSVANVIKGRCQPAHLLFIHPVRFPDEKQPVSQEFHQYGKFRPESTLDAVIFFSETLQDAVEKPFHEMIKKSGNLQIGIHLIAESCKSR